MKYGIIAAACLSLCVMQSEAAVMEVGYCRGEASGKPLSKVGNCDVSAAIMLTPDKLSLYEGADITGIRLCLATTDNLVDLTAWVRDDLSGTNLAEGIGEVKEGWQTVALDRSLKVDGRPLVIGYTYNQTKTSKCIAMGGDINPLGHYYAKRGEWETPASPEGSVCVELVVEGDMVATSDLAVESLTLLDPVVKASGEIVMKAKVGNSSLSVIDGFSYSATSPLINHNLVDGVWDQPIQPKQMVEIELAISSDGLPLNENIPLSFTIDDNGYMANNIRSASCGIYEEAFSRKLLLEEFTTEECPNCPRAINSIATALEAGYGDSMVVVAHHVGFYTDWLTIAEESKLLWFYGDDGSFAPAAMFDRTVRTEGLDTPVESVGYYDTFGPRLEEAIGKPGFVRLNVGAYESEGSMHVSVEAEAHPLLKTLLPEPRLTVLLIEDGIRHHHQAGISNPDFSHSHVSRAYLTDIFGDTVEFGTDGRMHWAGSIPASTDWVPDNMEAVAFINAYDPSDRTACQVYNVATCHLSTAAVDSIGADATAMTEYLDMAGRRVGPDAKGILIKTDRLPDGSVHISKIIR